MLELRGKIAECYVECFNRMFYVIFKDTTSGDIDNIENIMKDSYDEWVSGDNTEIIDIPCEEYILSTLSAYKHNIVGVIYEDDEDENN